MEQTINENEILYKLPLEDMDLSVRVYNVLKEYGCRTFGDLVTIKKEDLLKIKSVGVKVVKYIFEKKEEILNDYKTNTGRYTKQNIKDSLEKSNSIKEIGLSARACRVLTKNANIYNIQQFINANLLRKDISSWIGAGVETADEIIAKRNELYIKIGKEIPDEYDDEFGITP